MASKLNWGDIDVRLWLIGALLAAVCGPAVANWNEPNVEGTKEHPVIKLYPHARVSDFDEKDFDSAEVVTGVETNSDGDPEVKTEEIEGRVWRYSYEHKPGTSAFEILKQYETALSKAGFVKLAGGRTNKLPSHPLVRGETFGAFRLDRDGKPAIYVNLNATDQGTYTESNLVIVEPGAMEQKLGADADGFYKALQETGRVAVYGITFETGKATIDAGSDAVLQEVETLLEAHPELKLKIEGHTDNVGQPAANKKLSQARAAAVLAWLLSHGISPTRLMAVGYGDTKPVADNSSDEGRAQNRRVELVK